MINEEISKEAGQAAQTIISYTIKATKESINLEKEIRKKMNETLEKANGNLKSLMGDEMKIKDLAKENKKEKESILKQIKKYKDLSKNKDKTKEKGKRKVKEKVKPNKKDMTREI